MDCIEVNDKKTRKEFIRVPKIMYQKDPNWICPLDMEIENIFNPRKNTCFKHGDAIRWVLKDDLGSLIGRIAAFYDKNKAFQNQQPTGAIGFFECIDDQQAANLLFQTAREWLEANGMQAMDGPINFGENFVNWGLLVEGFTQQGYGMPYNFPYYKELFENYGFRNYYEQYSFHDVFSNPYPEKLDIIFCRNVMIYFDKEHQKKLIAGFYRVLFNTGFLFIGHSETLHSISDDFSYVKILDSPVYIPKRS